MEWLTPEDAIAAANLTATPTKLLAIAQSNNTKRTAEERFQALGLLFDRERYEAGHPNFLKPLTAVTEESPEPPEEDSETPDDEETPDPPSLAQQTEPYIFDQCKVQIVITLLPDTRTPGGRPVMLAASSHGDFPIVVMLTQEKLGTFPPAIAQLLEDLKADFPNRQIRRSIAQSQTTRASPQRATPPQASAVRSTTEKSPDKAQTQISLF
jgi:hypothetical protein